MVLACSKGEARFLSFSVQLLPRNSKYVRRVSSSEEILQLVDLRDTVRMSRASDRVKSFGKTGKPHRRSVRIYIAMKL